MSQTDFGKEVARQHAKASTVERASVRSFTPDPKNANRGTDRGRSLLVDSISRLGAGRSILLDKNGLIIAGNKTAESYQASGKDDVLVIKTDGTKLVAVMRTDLDLAEDPAAIELGLADNRIAELDLLWAPEVLKQLQDGNTVDLANLFDEKELDSILASLEPVALATDEDEVPPTPEKPVTRPGDLYVLGNHRLLCGDSTSPKDVARLMGKDKADMVWTDPPYNVAYTGGTKKALTIQNDKMGKKEFRIFLESVFHNALEAAEQGAAVYIAHADMEGYNFRGAMEDSGWSWRQNLIWAKNSLVIGRWDYQSKHEPIMYGWKPGTAHRWFGDRKQTTLLQFDRPTRSTEHPTMKPVALVEYCIANSSASGDIVLDLFGGSGTTLIACEKIHRRGYLMELDARYCDVIVARYEQATGQKVVKYAA